MKKTSPIAQMGAKRFTFFSSCPQHAFNAFLVNHPFIQLLLAEVTAFVAIPEKDCATQTRISATQHHFKSVATTVSGTDAQKNYPILAVRIKSTSMKPKLLAALLMLSTAFGCYYENEEELYNCTIDAANIKYSTTINNVLTAYGCIGCHGTLAPADNITLNTYAGVKAVVTNGKLYGAINHAPGYIPMPQGSAKMTVCDIKKVKAWIDAGAPNN